MMSTHIRHAMGSDVLLVCLCLTLLAVAVPVHGAQPPGINEKLYNCTYPTTGLVLTVNGSLVACGKVADETKTFLVRNVQSPPQISLRDADPKDRYAAFLLNPLAGLMGSFLTPILHSAAGNIPGSELADGRLGAADTISRFYPPNPPIPGVTGQFVYLVFVQKRGSLIDWTDVSALCKSSGPTPKFPIESVAANKSLTLIAANYFSVKKEW